MERKREGYHWECGLAPKKRVIQPKRTRDWEELVHISSLFDETAAGSFCCWPELRKGGAVARHPGEERLVIRRSVGKGRQETIAKLVFSSSTQDRQNIHSTVHVLEVKNVFRGLGLGSLLIHNYLASLHHCYFGQESPEQITSVTCQLEAEEELNRHGKLVGLYESLGWQVKANSKVQYLNNNDGETYRKVPMQLCLHPSLPTASLVPSRRRFIPVVLSSQSGSESKHVTRLILLEDSSECIVFQFSGGQEIQSAGFKTLCFVDPVPADNGCCFLHKFWLFQTCEGEARYLTLDNNGQNGLHLSRSPILWKASKHNDSVCSFCCTQNTPKTRLQYLNQWSLQSVEFVQSMHKRYRSFQLAQLSLFEVLKLARSFPWDRAIDDEKGETPSLLACCFATAEVFRGEGQPDWMQLLALLYHLGGVVKRLDPVFEAEYDWTIPSQSWVVGCRPPVAWQNGDCYDNFHSLNPDANDPRFNTTRGMYEMHCGLDQTLLTWSAPEYMFHLLGENRANSLPEEGLGMLRYASLRCWHSSRGSVPYSSILNDQDMEMRSVVADFARLLDESLLNVQVLSDNQCFRLWANRYSFVAHKYGLAGTLRW